MMNIKSFRQLYSEDGAPTNSTGAPVDQGNPKPLYKKLDRRSKWHVENLYKKCKG